MTWREKLKHIRALSPRATPVVRDNGTWYVAHSDVEIGGNGMLRSPTQAARTAAGAVRECWKQLTSIRGRPLRVIKDAMLLTRREYVWAGDQWAHPLAPREEAEHGDADS